MTDRKRKIRISCDETLEFQFVFVFEQTMSLSTIDSREWGKLFPLEITTKSDSTLFIHRLFTVTLSALTAKRHIFSNDHFSSKKLASFSVPLFTRSASISEQKRFNSTVFSWVFIFNMLSEIFNPFSYLLDPRCISSYFQRVFEISYFFCHIQSR